MLSCPALTFAQWLHRHDSTFILYLYERLFTLYAFDKHAKGISTMKTLNFVEPLITVEKVLDDCSSNPTDDYSFAYLLNLKDVTDTNFIVKK